MSLKSNVNIEYILIYFLFNFENIYLSFLVFNSYFLLPVSYANLLQRRSRNQSIFSNTVLFHVIKPCDYSSYILTSPPYCDN